MFLVFNSTHYVIKIYRNMPNGETGGWPLEVNRPMRIIHRAGDFILKRRNRLPRRFFDKFKNVDDARVEIYCTASEQKQCVTTREQGDCETHLCKISSKHGIYLITSTSNALIITYFSIIQSVLMERWRIRLRINSKNYCQWR